MGLRSRRSRRRCPRGGRSRWTRWATSTSSTRSRASRRVHPMDRYESLYRKLRMQKAGGFTGTSYEDKRRHSPPRRPRLRATSAASARRSPAARARAARHAAGLDHGRDGNEARRRAPRRADQAARPIGSGRPGDGDGASNLTKRGNASGGSLTARMRGGGGGMTSRSKMGGGGLTSRLRAGLGEDSEMGDPDADASGMVTGISAAIEMATPRVPSLCSTSLG